MAKKAYPFYGLVCLETAQPLPGPMPMVPAQAAPPSLPARILPELHLNIWEKGEWFFGEQAFIDVGLMLDARETAKSYEFLVPWKVEKEHLEDLSPRIFRGSGAVPAIFNEAWAITAGNGSAGYVRDPSTAAVLFTIIQCQSELKTREVVHDGKTLVAITIDVDALRNKSAKAQVTSDRMYLRFRIHQVPKDFYRVGINQKDRLLLSSWQRTEILDFRLNVRRGIPLGLDTDVGGTFAQFGKVHLFLMKSREHDIVFQDHLFRACRSLEDEDFWAEYSWPKEAANPVQWWTKRRVKRSLGYQWSNSTKSVPSHNPPHIQSRAATQQGSTAANPFAPNVPPAYTILPVAEFGILARFKEVRFGVKKFVFLALVVGALGNALWDVVKHRYENTNAGITLKNWLAPIPATGSLKGDPE